MRVDKITKTRALEYIEQAKGLLSTGTPEQVSALIDALKDSGRIDTEIERAIFTRIKEWEKD